MTDTANKRQQLEKKVLDAQQQLSDAKNALKSFLRDHPDSLPKQATLQEIREFKSRSTKAAKPRAAKPRE